VITGRSGPGGDTGVTGATGATGPVGMFELRFYPQNKFRLILSSAMLLDYSGSLFLLNIIVNKSSAVDEMAIRNPFACLIMVWLCA